MVRRSYYIINGITVYRLLAAPLMVIFIFNRNLDLFKWLLPLSFFTDLVDGYLARKFKVTSILGTKLDSIADDLTIVAAVIGIFVFKPGFIRENILVISIMLVLYVLQIVLSLVRYHKLSGFHTYTAKTAAILQGTFLILVFILSEPIYWLFYLAAFVTTLDLIEETILVLLLPEWEANVKGIYWVMQKRKKKRN